jgi:hypothetical protein
MTAQFPDTLRFDYQTFSIAGVNGEGLFHPASLGLTPFSTVTACWRGYVCHYLLADESLLLDGLDISLAPASRGRFDEHGRYIPSPEEAAGAGAPETVPEINGIRPGPGRFLRYAYAGLALPVPFTGGLLAADGFIQELYVHMGFHPAWKYRTVFELIFADGQLRERRDVSERVEHIRDKMKAAPLTPDPRGTNSAELDAWIRDTFRLSYDLGE